MIDVSHISKTYKVAQRKKGALGAMGALFKRDYKEIKALDDISFHIDPGEIVGYIGPNGAGKSTTIKVISGILVPDSGRCTAGGFVPWKDRRAYVQHIGVVFGQRTQLWWDVPVSDSFDLLKSIYRVPKDQYRQNYDMLVETLGLSEFLNTPLRQLSLGQRMRAEIAASLLHGPDILFLDEPTIGLDAVSKLAVRSFIKQMNRQRKLTVILTTHDMNDIEALTDRIILIGKGKILHDGSMQAIKDRFGRSRWLSVTFAEREEPVLVPGAELVHFTAGQAVYQYDPQVLKPADLLADLSRELDITDMVFESVSLEEVIASLYRQHDL